MQRYSPEDYPESKWLSFSNFIELVENNISIFHKVQVIEEKIHIFYYEQKSFDLFNTKLERECRGIVFDDFGNIICRPFHKFFNVGEREETSIDKLEKKFIHTIANKIDGALITPVLFKDKVRWKSKTSFFSDIANLVQSAWNNKEDWVYKYKDIVMECLESNSTPLFELTTPTNRIIIDYGKDSLLTYLGYRDNLSGEYWVSPDIVNKELTKKLHTTGYTFQHLLYEIKTMENIEGFCAYSMDHEIYKIKTPWYVLKHTLKSQISYKNILNIIENNSLCIDDVIAELSILGLDELSQMIIRIVNEVDHELFNLITTVDYKYDNIKLELGENISKKDFANYVREHNPDISFLLFSLYDKNKEKFSRDARKYVIRNLYTKYKNKDNNYV